MIIFSIKVLVYRASQTCASSIVPISRERTLAALILPLIQIRIVGWALTLIDSRIKDLALDLAICILVANIASRIEDKSCWASHTLSYSCVEVLAKRAR